MRPRTLAAPVTLLLAAGLLAACSSDDDAPRDGAEGAATALAEGLASGDLSEVTFTQGTPSEITDDLAATVEGMGEITPEVTLGDVEESGEEATATLTWSWPLTDADTWTYESTVALERGGEGAADPDAWSVVWGHDVVEPSLNAASTLDVTPVTQNRGDILGQGGVKLVTDRPVLRLGIDRIRVPSGQAGASARALATLADLDVSPYVKAVEAAGDRAFVDAITYRRDDIPQNVLDGYEQIKGALLLSDTRALAPTREFAAPILGTVGPVTADMVKDDPDTYQAGDIAGLSGLQARYDEQLRGSPGLVVNAVGSEGAERRLFKVGGEKGEPLDLTLDKGLQTLAEGLLADVGAQSSLVAIRPSDGAILAAANGPGNNGQNLATFGQYPPGSTFKSVSSLALLRAGVKPNATVECPATIDVDGRDFENYDDYPSSALGRIPFRTALANSCNTAFIGLRTKLDDGDLAAAAGSLGLGIDRDVGFPAYFGSVEPPTSETGRAADMIGQGTILASPMAMATVIASIQAGETVVPRLIADLDVEPTDADPLGAGEATQLQRLLRGVVTSGSGSLLADVPGPPVIAKTGTAEFDDDGTTRTHAWMIAAQGDLAVAVFVGLGSSGSGTAGPILESFLRGAR